jgi:choline dehydrogenase-like flavoprotein
VEIERDGARETFSADVVVVSAGAVNSAALLLRSANDMHPHGLANSSDQVGRNYMCHINSALIAISKEPNPTLFQKTLGLNDFYWGDDQWDFPLGHIQMLGKSDGQLLRAGAPKAVPTPVLDLMAKHAIDFWLTTEDLPSPDNRVLVDKQGRIHLHYTDRNIEPHKRLVGKLKALLPALGCRDHLFPNQMVRDERIPVAGVAHQCGTVRFGDDPERSVLDVDCKAHDLDNLYVVDASFFPSASAVNPALTVMANALRVGDHLIERLGASVAEEVAA